MRNDPDIEVAPLIDDFIGSSETWKQLQEQQEQCEFTNNYYNYLLRCTDGIFKDKFFYINTTEDGESFGSGDPDALDLTMYIETAGLSDRHAEIKFVENSKYVLRDCDSESGTWLRIGHAG